MVCLNPLCAKNPMESFAIPSSVQMALFEQSSGIDPYLPIHQAHQRQKPRTAKVGAKYRSAVAYEMSKQISSGSYKNCRLDQVITDPKF